MMPFFKHDALTKKLGIAKKAGCGPSADGVIAFRCWSCDQLFVSKGYPYANHGRGLSRPGKGDQHQAESPN